MADPADPAPWRGFRLFFPLAALQAALFLPLWWLRYTGSLPLDGHLAGAVWHGHEMVFGYVAAVLAGFLLVASGGPRIWLLAALWLAGRTLAFAPLTAPWLAAVVDLAFLPMLVLLRRPPLWYGAKLMSLGILLVILGLSTGNLWVHLAAIGGGDADRAVVATATLIALLLVLVGGRLVPGHTRATLRRGVGLRLAWAEFAGIPCGLAWVGAEAGGWPVVAGAAAGALGLLQLYRLARWWDRAVLADPLLWVLHAGFAWLALGLLLTALGHLTGAVPPVAALHAVLVGAVGSLTLGIMTRLSLQHTKRPLVAGRASTVAFGLMQAAAAARLAAILPDAAMTATAAATLAWTAAFVAFFAAHGRALLAGIRSAVNLRQINKEAAGP